MNIFSFFFRRRKFSNPNATTENNMYAEVDENMPAQLTLPSNDAQVIDPVYEVNIEGMKSETQITNDDADYEDVNNKLEPSYLELNKSELEMHHEYLGLGDKPTTGGKSSSSLYANQSRVRDFLGGGLSNQALNSTL